MKKGSPAGKWNKRKLPSERKRMLRVPRHEVPSRLHEHVGFFFIELGLPNPFIPVSYKDKPDEWKKLKMKELEEGKRLVEELDRELTAFETKFPELAKQLPWYETRKKWKAEGGELDELHLASVISGGDTFFKVAFYSSDFNKYVRGQGTRNVHGPEKLERIRQKKSALKADRMLEKERMGQTSTETDSK